MPQKITNLTDLLMKQGYSGYVKSLQGKISADHPENLKALIELCFAGKDINTMKSIRDYYLRKVER